MVLATPVLAITLVLLLLERGLHIGIFDPALGGDPVLFQHLFWFYSHPAVYIMILPGMGVVSEIVTCFSRKQIFGYQLHLPSRASAIAVIGFLVWGHHMFVSGQSVYAGMVFSLLCVPGRDPVGDQGLQLDRDALQGLDLLADADALRARLHRPVHDRRPDRAVPGRHRPRRPRHRHLLRGRALPLHHGRRRGHGLSRRPALLVAEDHRPAVSGILGEDRRVRSSSSAST